MSWAKINTVKTMHYTDERENLYPWFSHSFSYLDEILCNSVEPLRIYGKIGAGKDVFLLWDYIKLQSNMHRKTF
jgi:hypothetical protein